MFDLLIKCALAVTMDGERRVIPHCSIGVKDGRIEYIGGEIKAGAKKIIADPSLVAMPGMINCHTHVYQSLIEGIGYDMHFHPWNIRYLLPLVANIGPGESGISAQLAALEMIKSGTTAFSDHWYLHTDFANIEAVAGVFDKSGLRNHSVFGFLNESFAGRKQEKTASDMVKNDELLLQAARDFVNRWHNRGRTKVALGPGSTEDVSSDLFRKIIELGRELDVSVVTHLAGWVEIISTSLKKHRMRDIEYAHSLGFTNSKAIAIHAVWPSAEELNILAATGTKVVHNPVANMHLGYGIAPVAEMLSRGITVGLGTDGAASYTYNMLEIGKSAAMLQKARCMDAEALTAEKALEMLTIDGAEVLGLEKLCGSLEQGKEADIILLDFNQPHLLLHGRPAAKILYSATGADVKTVIIQGQLVMEKGRVLTLDEEAVLKDAAAAVEELIRKGGEETAALLNAPWPHKLPYWRMS